MSLYSRIVITGTVCLWSLTMLVGVTRLTTRSMTDVYSCDCEEMESSYPAYQWVSYGMMSTYHGIKQLGKFLTGNTLDMCSQQEHGLWDTIFGRKPKEKGLVTMAICDLQSLFIDLRSFSTVSLKEWFREMRQIGAQTWIIKSAKSLARSIKRAWRTFVDVPDHLGDMGHSNSGFLSLKNTALLSSVTSEHQYVLLLFGSFCVSLLAAIKLIPEFFNKWQYIFGRDKRNISRGFGSRYVAVKLLKSGKYFHSFQMMSKETDKCVFMKCNRRDTARTIRTGLARAFKATKALNHKNIVKFEDWIRVGGYRGLVFEFAPYGNLKDALPLDARKVSLWEKLLVFEQIISAVSFLHQSGAVHLNIRPGSVLVFDKWGSVKLSGFRRVTRVPPDVQCNVYDLHMTCRPAEVTANHSYDGYKADIWALGSLLFFIIVGDVFQRETKTPIHKTIMHYLQGYSRQRKRTVFNLLARLLSAEANNRPTLPEVQDYVDRLSDLKM